MREEYGQYALILTLTSHFPEDFVLIRDLLSEQLPLTDHNFLPFELVESTAEVCVELDARNVETFHVTVGLVAADAVLILDVGEDTVAPARTVTDTTIKSFLLVTIIASRTLSSLQTEKIQQR